MLEKCHRSVLSQSVVANHIFVADGFPRKELDSWQAEHFILPFAHRDYGGTPRALAALSAFQRGSDVVCFLDADNWYTPDHLKEMLALYQQTKADVCISHRQLYTVDEKQMPLSAEEDVLEDFADTNCLWMTRAVLPILPSWIYMGPRLSACGDFIFYQEIKAAGLKVARGTKATVCYRTRWKGHYEKANLTPPPDAETDDVTAITCAWCRALPEQEAQELRGLFLSKLEAFGLDTITSINDGYLDLPDGIALETMTVEHNYSVDGKTAFHVPKSFFPDKLAYSGVVLGIAAMDDKTLQGTLTYDAPIELNDYYYMEIEIPWTRKDYNLKFTLDAGEQRTLKIAWWVKPFSWEKIHD